MLPTLGSFTPTWSLPPPPAAAALNNTWRDVSEPHLFISFFWSYAKFPICIHTVESLFGSVWVSCCQGNGPKVCCWGLHNTNKLLWSTSVMFQCRGSRAPLQNQMEYVHAFSKLGLREGYTKRLLKFSQIRRQFGRNRKAIIKRQLSGSVILSQPRLQLASARF